MRALLRRPLLRAGGAQAEDFRLVRRYAAELRSWFDANTGWRLIVDSEVARLVKLAPTTDDPTHPARDPRSRAPFSRRRYVLTCLALSVLERSDAQITLGRLAESVILAAADEQLASAGVRLASSGREERGDLVAVVRLLLELGVLGAGGRRRGGFRARRRRCALRRAATRAGGACSPPHAGPRRSPPRTSTERLSQLAADPLPEAEDLRNRALRHHLTRRLLDDPVLYNDELDPAQAGLPDGPAGRAHAAHLRADRACRRGARGGDRDGRPGRRPDRCADARRRHRRARRRCCSPSTWRGGLGDDDSASARELDGGEALTRGRGCRAQSLASVPRPSCTGSCDGSRGAPAYWRRSAREPGAEVALVDTALERLAALRLVRRGPDGSAPLPALARYALAGPAIVTLEDPSSRLADPGLRAFGQSGQAR